MDGLSLKFTHSPLEGNFTFDEYGALVPDQSHLQMEYVKNDIVRQLKADTGLYRRMTDMYFKTDVEFTDNPTGNTPVIGVGVKKYGKRPLNVSFRERVDNLTKEDPKIKAQIEKRERKIVADQTKYMALHESLKPTDEHSTEYVQWLVEGEQVMTGGGFDNNAIGDVQKSALLFVSKGNRHPQYESTPFSRLVVEGSLKLKEMLEQAGLKPGTLIPFGCSRVRMDQDNDGLIGYPVYSKGWKELDTEVATRLLLSSGVDTRALVGKQVVDPRTGQPSKTQVVQAIAYVLDHTVVSDPSKLPSVITLLARIQKHGWKKEADEIVPKKSKTRSVYPNAALPGMIEAMVGTPFIEALQEHKFPFMPSLQDKPTRVQMLKSMYELGRSKGYEWLSLDESQYDATVIGGILATVMYYAVRPFFNAKYYDWVDFMIYCLTYKYIVCDAALCAINEDELRDAKDSGPWVDVRPFILFGMTDGLISGAKLTHVGGSLYGGAVIHYAMPKMMGFEPFIGVQAGDDCVWAYPKDRVDFTSMEKTYGPVEECAKTVGIDINKTKQIWFPVDGELVNIFLQDVYHETSGTWGSGSIFRPLDAVFFSERTKDLSIAEQFIAEISRMNQGADSAFAKDGVREWLSQEKFIGSLFKEYGLSAFDKIVESIGLPIEDIAQRIEVGSFTFGVSKEDMKNGSLPILPVIRDVASEMTFDVSPTEALKSLGIVDSVAEISDADGLGNDTPDVGDSDDVLLTNE
jgi:hypothetical protein